MMDTHQAEGGEGPTWDEVDTITQTHPGRSNIQGKREQHGVGSDRALQADGLSAVSRVKLSD